MKKITINDITLRDLFQNADPAAVDTAVLDTLISHYDGMGFDRLEVLGGSTFEKMLENNFYKTPFQICSYIHRQLPKVPLQVLIGARNLVGLEMYSADIIDRFISSCLRNGIYMFRVYDALNDIEHFKYTAERIIGLGGRLQGALIYDHKMDNDFYSRKAGQLADLGCEEICIKDVESTLVPAKAAILFKELSSKTDTPLHLSAFNVRGLQGLNYYQAAINGASGVDLSFMPSSYNDYNPSVFTFLNSIKGTCLEHNLDYGKSLGLYEDIKKYIYPSLNHSLSSDNFILRLHSESLLPKWLINAISRQLKEIGEIEQMGQVVDEIIKIKKELGNPTLATPIGQIIASQAILNSIISDNRWDITSDEIKKFAAGYFGKASASMDSKVKSLIFKKNQEEEYQKYEAADTFKQCESELADITSDEEHILSYCFFPDKTLEFLKDKKKSKTGNGKNVTGKPNLDKINMKKLREITDLVETSNIEKINFEIEGIKISINKSSGTAPQRPGPAKQAEHEIPQDITEVKSPIVGTFYRAESPQAPPFVKEGQKIKKGDTLCIIEAMKLMNKITSDTDGVVEKITAANEDPVEFGQTLMVIRKGKDV